MGSAYTLYVAGVAISNVFLGVLLARLCPLRVPADTPLKSYSTLKTVAHSAGVIGIELTGSNSTKTDSDLLQIDQKPNLKTDLPNDEFSNEAVSRIESLADFFQHLFEIQSRIEYCTSLGDKALLKAAAEQLIAAIKHFYAQFADAVFSTSRSPAQNNLLAGIPVTEVELLAAQIESTANNISMIDWSESVVDISARLEHELAHLNQEHKRLAVTANTQSALLQ